MKLKSLVVCASLLMGSSNLMAQSTISGSAGGIKAPASTMEISPTVAAGARTYMTGPITGTASKTVGPFVTPGIDLNLKGGGIDAHVMYTAEIGAARGYSGAAKSYSGNSYVEHDPILTLNYDINSKWKFVSYSEAKFHEAKTGGMDSYSEINLIPELQRTLNDKVAVSLGYFMKRISMYETSFALEDNKKGGAGFNSVNPNSQSPRETYHYGIAKATINFAPETKLVSYVTYGRLLNNDVTAGSGMSGRFNNDLDIPVIKNLGASLRYRLQIDTADVVAAKILNLGRVILNYDLTKSVQLNLQNTFDTISQNRKATIYEDENYLGATYKF